MKSIIIVNYAYFTNSCTDCFDFYRFTTNINYRHGMYGRFHQHLHSCYQIVSYYIDIHFHQHHCNDFYHAIARHSKVMLNFTIEDFFLCVIMSGCDQSLVFGIICALYAYTFFSCFLQFLFNFFTVILYLLFLFTIYDSLSNYFLTIMYNIFLFQQFDQLLQQSNKRGQTDLSMSASNIKVFCRFRPFNKQQLENKAQKIHRIMASKQLVIKDPNRSQQISFMFDNVFDCDSTQQQVYQSVGSPVLSNILDGFNGTIMAYGQTSSGKTHTMQGHDINDKEIKGLIPRIIENLFTAIEKSTENLQFKLKVSIFELYMEKLRDLLDVSKNDLKIRQNKHSGPYVQHLTEVYISDKVQFYKLIHLGQKNRATCMTNMNALSSRSHMIFLLNLNQLNLETSQAKTSKLFLIDLAGSQKVSKTGAEGKVLDQAKKINLSLTSLGMVIKSLSEHSAHVPYRDSKLTRVIKDSLGGNAKTTLIVTCSPHQIHVSQTISTLRFGQNAQKIKNKPKINRQLTVPELQKIIEELEAKIEQKNEWIKILQEYIKKDLNASLPKFQKKIKIAEKQKEAMVQENETEIKLDEKEVKIQEMMRKKTSERIQQTEVAEQEQILSQSDNKNENQIMKNQIQAETTQNNRRSQVEQKVKQIENSYNYEQIASLQAELEAHKQNMQAELNKFYQLKKEYNSLNENLKELIEQNINYQQKQKQYEFRINQEKQIIANNLRKNCSLVFGEILDACGFCTLNNRNSSNSKSCYQKIRAIIDGKGRNLCLDGERVDFFDYWKTQKQAINKKMQEVINKSMSMQKKIEKRQQNTDAEQRKSEQNKKIIEMQQKLDGLYSEYQQMLTLQTNWKVECQLYERKLKMKQQKIVELRNMLEQMQQQMELMDQQNNETMSVNTKIVKPLKGGFLFR